jgi:hypothetical protein
VARTVGRRVVDAARQSLSLEGLVAALVGGGVWAIAAGVLTQATSVRIGPATAVSAGFGLLASAAFVWLVVRSDRQRQQKRVDVLRSTARKHLSTLSREGHFDWSQVRDPDASIAEWRRDVESFLLEAFGRQLAEEFAALPTVEEKADMLDVVNRRLGDDLRLLPGYGGWGPGRR